MTFPKLLWVYARVFHLLYELSSEDGLFNCNFEIEINLIHAMKCHFIERFMGNVVELSHAVILRAQDLLPLVKCVASLRAHAAHRQNDHDVPQVLSLKIISSHVLIFLQF